MIRRGGIQVDSIEIHAPGVGPVVAAVNPVRIQHRDDFEDETFPQHDRDGVISSHKKWDHAVEHVAGRRLAGMDSRAKKYHLEGMSDVQNMAGR